MVPLVMWTVFFGFLSVLARWTGEDAALVRYLFTLFWVGIVGVLVMLELKGTK